MSTPASHFLASRRRMRSLRSSLNSSSPSNATSSRKALMLQTRTAAVTRRLVITTLSPPAESPKPAPLVGETFRVVDAYPHTCDGLAHTDQA
eukprot:6175969-Pleurochrysis_carterae.AAC.3